MLTSLSFAALLLAMSRAFAAGQHCLYSAVPPSGLKVNCSSLKPRDLSLLPPDTTQLYLQGNWLTSVPPGLFDKLVALEKISLSGNPFHCDCRIQYLRSWLQRNRAIVSKSPTCASPRSVAQKPIIELSDDYFSSSARPSCTNGIYNTVTGVVIVCLIVLLLWSLKVAKVLTITLYIDERQSEFKANSFYPPKPKHRRRLHTGLSDINLDYSSTHTVALEKPRVSVDLLPQILDVLHKKHNIKIKPT
ncbi:uncharacterized protein V6R79_024986 [Siganus canaliculatus]